MFFVQLCDISIVWRKCWLTLLERKTRETLKEDKKHKTRNFLSSSFCEEKMSLRKILQSSVYFKSPKKRRKKTLSWLFFWSFLSLPHFSSSSLCFLSFFLSLRPRNQNSFFFSRAKTERERLREAFEKAFFDSFYLYEYIKGRRRWKFFFNDSPHF